MSEKVTKGRLEIGYLGDEMGKLNQVVIVRNNEILHMKDMQQVLM